MSEKSSTRWSPSTKTDDTGCQQQRSLIAQLEVLAPEKMLMRGATRATLSRERALALITG